MSITVAAVNDGHIAMGGLAVKKGNTMIGWEGDSDVHRYVLTKVEEDKWDIMFSASALRKLFAGLIADYNGVQRRGRTVPLEKWDCEFLIAQENGVYHVNHCGFANLVGYYHAIGSHSCRALGALWVLWGFRSAWEQYDGHSELDSCYEMDMVVKLAMNAAMHPDEDVIDFKVEDDD